MASVLFSPEQKIFPGSSTFLFISCGHVFFIQEKKELHKPRIQHKLHVTNFCYWHDEFISSWLDLSHKAER